jgi:hypothetical protein
MSKHTLRNLTLVTTLLVGTISAAYAADPTPAPPPITPSSVTGTDPEPSSPNIVDIVLSVLHLS